MKVLLINGSPHKTGCTYTALHEVEMTLQKHGIETEIFFLGNKPIGGCIGCGNCSKTGECFQKDVLKDLSKRAISLVRQSTMQQLRDRLLLSSIVCSTRAAER